METVPIVSQDLRGILDQYLHDIQTRVDQIKVDKQYDKDVGPKDADFWVSKEYLDIMKAKKNPPGFPESCWGISVGASAYGKVSTALIDVAVQLDKDLNSLLGARNCAVKMYYPKGGWMGWHHNANAPGHNILLSWTENGNSDGFFRSEDPITKEWTDWSDAPGGWTCKVGYFGSFKEPDKVFWHCVRAYEPRITLGFIIPDENMWRSMIDDISENY